MNAWQNALKRWLGRPGNLSLLSVSVLLLVSALVLGKGRSSEPEPQPAAVSEQVSEQKPEPVSKSVVSEPAESVTESEPLSELASEPDDSADSAALNAEQPAARLVLILDDIGYNAEAGRRAVELPGQVTYAVIPFTPHGRLLAEAAHRAGKEVMLHAPMSNLGGMDLGEGGLTLQQSEEEFVHTLRRALAEIPHIKGLNNHTGSELTAARQPMQWVMQELKQHDLYFVDSLTTNVSVAADTAEQYQVPSLRRHVFLDNIQSEEAIDREFQRAVALAQKQGFAVAIGHPYAATLAYLEKALPSLEALNIALLPPSGMIAHLRSPESEPDAEPEVTPDEAAIHAAAEAAFETTDAW